MNQKLMCFGCVCCVCFVLMGCSESEDKQKKGTCDESSYVSVCSADKRSFNKCVSGRIRTVLCDVSETCINGDCIAASIEPDNINECNESIFVDKCENSILQTCVGGVITKLPCRAGCDGNDCREESQEEQPQADDCDSSSYIAYCDGNDLVRCLGGSIVRQNCTQGCEKGLCIGAAPIADEPGCGNLLVEEGEVCDGANLNGLTCRDVPGYSKKKGYKGTPECNEDCSGLKRGTCEESPCGDGVVDRSVGEICDYDNKYEYWAGDYTCDDYMPGGYEWVEGGEPGCSRNCRGVSKGTCQLKSQPIDGIETCQFESLDIDQGSHLASARARVKVQSDVPSKNVWGRLACAIHSDTGMTMTYTWSLKTAAALAQCSDCEADEYMLVTETNYSEWLSGDYDCVFMVAASGRDSYYICPVEYGYPIPQGIIPDDSMKRQFHVTQVVPEGTVIAHWDFAGYEKDQTPSSIKANDGIYKTRSVLKMSDESAMRMVSGTGGYPEVAASSAKWPESSTYNANAKHFVFSVPTTGYQNVRVQFKVAGSGTNEKRVTGAYKSGSQVNVIGNELIFTSDRDWVSLPETILSGADNQDMIELRVYGYGPEYESSNATVRVDDIYVIGDGVQ